MRFLLLFLYSVSWGGVSTWSVQAPDGQTFSLQKIEKKDSDYWISFERGERKIKKLPILEKDWLGMRMRLTRLMSDSLQSVKCQHPLEFSQTLAQNKATKSVCLNSKQSAELQNLLKEMRHYLFGE